MVKSSLTGRTHHYLSKLEYSAHLIAEYTPSVIDIREQFALLPWNDTKAIAEALQIPHPIYPGSCIPTVMTTDLVLTLKEPDGIRLLAVSVKMTKDLTRRTLEKLALEKSYWTSKGIDWVLETEQSLPMVRARNLEFFENSRHLVAKNEASISPTSFAKAFEGSWSPHMRYVEILKTTCKKIGIDENAGHNLLGSAIWARTSRIDIESNIIGHRTTVALQQEICRG